MTTKASTAAAMAAMGVTGRSSGGPAHPGDDDAAFVMAVHAAIHTADMHCLRRLIPDVIGPPPAGGYDANDLAACADIHLEFGRDDDAAACRGASLLLAEYPKATVVAAGPQAVLAELRDAGDVTCLRWAAATGVAGERPHEHVGGTVAKPGPARGTFQAFADGWVRRTRLLVVRVLPLGTEQPGDDALAVTVGGDFVFAWGDGVVRAGRSPCFDLQKAAVDDDAGWTRFDATDDGVDELARRSVRRDGFDDESVRHEVRAYLAERRHLTRERERVRQRGRQTPSKKGTTR